jgi:hypothetical protein
MQDHQNATASQPSLQPLPAPIRPRRSHVHGRDRAATVLEPHQDSAGLRAIPDARGARDRHWSGLGRLRGCYRIMAPLVEPFRRATCCTSCAMRVERRRAPKSPTRLRPVRGTSSRRSIATKRFIAAHDAAIGRRMIGGWQWRGRGGAAAPGAGRPQNRVVGSPPLHPRQRLALGLLPPVRPGIRPVRSPIWQREAFCKRFSAVRVPSRAPSHFIALFIVGVLALFKFAPGSNGFSPCKASRLGRR